MQHYFRRASLVFPDNLESVNECVNAVQMSSFTIQLI